MLQRLLPAPNLMIKVIFISITFVVLSACGTHHTAQVSDRDPPPSRRIAVHHVAKGETLFSIAWRYGLDYRDLADYNRISQPYTIYPGQTIHLAVPPRTATTASSTPARPATAPPPMATKPATQSPSTPAKSPPARITPPVISPNRSETKAATPPPPKQQPLVISAPQWQWPAQGRVIATFQGNTGLNKGIDIAGNIGQPVLAAASGQVVYAGTGLRGYGKLLIIKHNETFLSAYAHNDELLVKEGDTVKGGQRIADMGSSSADRVKLHFEIRRGGTPVDPLKYLPGR